jgi:hypothetical protein
MAELFILTATVIAAFYFTRMALKDFLAHKDFREGGE